MKGKWAKTSINIMNHKKIHNAWGLPLYNVLSQGSSLEAKQISLEDYRELQVRFEKLSYLYRVFLKYGVWPREGHENNARPEICQEYIIYQLATSLSLVLNQRALFLRSHMANYYQ